MSKRTKQEDQWWDSANNDFDNDIEQFSRNDGLPGGGGCLTTIMMMLVIAGSLPIIIAIFV